MSPEVHPAFDDTYEILTSLMSEWGKKLGQTLILL